VVGFKIFIYLFIYIFLNIFKYFNYLIGQIGVDNCKAL